MKAIYLVGSLILTVLILILAFGNISSQCSGLYFLFYAVETNPTIIFLAIAVMGIITGAMYHAFMVRVLSSSDEEEDEKFE